MKVYIKIQLNLPQSWLFQTRHSAISAKFIELSSWWRTYTTKEPQLHTAYTLQTVHSSLNHMLS